MAQPACPITAWPSGAPTHNGGAGTGPLFIPRNPNELPVADPDPDNCYACDNCYRGLAGDGGIPALKSGVFTDWTA